MDRSTPQLEMPIPTEFINAIAERVADIILDRLADGPRGSDSGAWMRSGEVAQYLGWSRKSVYRRVARMEMPHYKVDGILLFKRDELDAWLEQFREEPREQDLPSDPSVLRAQFLPGFEYYSRTPKSIEHLVDGVSGVVEIRFFQVILEWAGLDSNQRPWD